MSREFDTGNLADYSMPVHQSLLQPVQFFGIGQQAFLVIVMATTVLSTLISVWCIAIGVVALFVAKRMCKDEPFLLDFTVQNLGQEELYRS